MGKYRAAIFLIVTIWAGPAAFAVPFLFNGWGAGQFGLVAVTPTVNLSGNVSAGSANINDGAIAVGTGVNLNITGGTVTGAIDFADGTTKNTGGNCPSDAGGVCRVNTASSFSGDTVTGVTMQFTSAVSNAITEWSNLVNGGSGWGLATGATAANLHQASGPIVLCAGSSTGCTFTATTAVTRNIGGVLETAYLFDISSTTGGVINQNVTIKGDGSTLVVLLYNSAAALNVSKMFSLSGVSADQVLLNDTGSGGITTGSGFNFTGAIAVSGNTQNLTSAVINGRLFLNGSSGGSASLPSFAPSFALNAPGDLPTPEPNTMLLIGGSLVLVSVGWRWVSGSRRSGR